jgi:hypothetical protein
MPAYNATGYDPPAPVATVTLRDAISGTQIPNVSLLLDTGADVTLLPRGAVARLGVTPANGAVYELIGFDGTRTTAQAVDLDMIFLNRAYRGRYLLTEGEHGVMGRDVLANLVLIFDGPQQAWSER